MMIVFFIFFLFSMYYCMNRLLDGSRVGEAKPRGDNANYGVHAAQPQVLLLPSSPGPWGHRSYFSQDAGLTTQCHQIISFILSS
jgi:hypothetical protein